jgi:alpha-L-arabinofuranosidase
MLKAYSPQASNTLEEPANIVPVESTLRHIGPEMHYTAPAYSIQVIQIEHH